MAQQGQDRTKLPEKDRGKDQGPKTRAKNRELVKSGSPDQGAK